MTDPATESNKAPKPQAPAQEPNEAEQPKPEVEETDWKAEARKWEQRAKDNKSAAERLAQIEEANKSEAQKLADAKAAAEKERDDARREALRLRIATKFGVSDEDADLFLTGSDEETLTKQAKRLAAREEAAGKPRAPRPDPNQGRNNNSPASTADQFAAAVEGALNT